MEGIFHGETTCQKTYPPDQGRDKRCPNKAYYQQQGKALCGVHSDARKRKVLPKNPRAKEVKEQRLKDHQATVDRVQASNRKDGLHGNVTCSKLRMMKNPDDIAGYLKVFPNFKHQNRRDGFGCAALSPKRLGPVEHRQRGLPPARTLENYHQFNKVYKCEVDKKDGQPTEKFYQLQKAAYKSSEAKRHKYDKKTNPKSKEDLRVLYTLHSDSEGKVSKYTYIQSRYLYCHFYEILAREQRDFSHLKELVAKGTNIQIVGYDSYEVTKDLMQHYVDGSRPFGHELCLYTMLTVADPGDYPWNRYYTEHKQLYPEYLAPHSPEEAEDLVDMDTSDDMVASGSSSDEATD